VAIRLRRVASPVARNDKPERHTELREGVRLLLATKSDYFSEVVDAGQVVGFKDAIVGEANPGLVMELAELLSNRRHDSAGHTAVRHN